jgi:oxygen-independent coproporphyrinogen-3 oxidase
VTVRVPTPLTPVLLTLLERYDRPGPRYTSYPTVPVWTPSFDALAYGTALSRVGAEDHCALYAHFPFCGRKCLYCGCNMLVTSRASHIDRYLDGLEREVAMVMDRLGARPRVTQMHWGGGTPNLLTLPQLVRAFEIFESRVELVPGAELSIEADPRHVSRAQLRLLRELGFTRISFGVQDLDEDVQRAIGRLQPYELVREVCEGSREAGFEGVNLDVMYGLPRQTVDSLRTTIDQVVGLAPDRIACFGYAHVPWLRSHQRAIRVDELPDARERMLQFIAAATAFQMAGYRWLGLDHFAAPDDSLSRAQDQGELHRNFMGYTTMPAEHLLGFGMSAISEVSGSYVQNAAELGSWREAVDHGRLPIVRGHQLTADDQWRRDVIMSLRCDLRAALPARGAALEEIRERLMPMLDDGLVRLDDDRVEVTQQGRYFVRQVCMAFDAHLQPESALPAFSRTI